MMETGELDFTKPHMILGAGPGRDLVIQNGKYYTSWGKQISPTKRDLEEAGIPFNREISIEIQKRNLQAKHDEERRKLEEMLKKIDEEESARIKAGLPASFEDDPEEEVAEPLDLSGLDELDEDLPVLVAPVKVKAKSKK